MKVFVCVKQVPDTETKIKLLPDASGIDTAGVKWVMNPYDEFAVEEAIKFKEKNSGAQVFVITAGPKARAQEVLRTALAMGADEGILVDLPDQVDATTTSKALASAIQKEGGCHLVLTGKLAIDDNASSVPQMVAELLSIPHATVVSKIDYSSESVVVERDVEGGAKEISKLMAPALMAANKGLNMPRYASLPGIMKAKKKVLKEYSLADLGVAAGETKLTYNAYSLPAEKPPAKILSGDFSSQTQELIRLLRDEAKVL